MAKGKRITTRLSAEDLMPKDDETKGIEKKQGDDAASAEMEKKNDAPLVPPAPPAPPAPSTPPPKRVPPTVYVLLKMTTLTLPNNVVVCWKAGKEIRSDLFDVQRLIAQGVMLTKKE